MLRISLDSRLECNKNIVVYILSHHILGTYNYSSLTGITGELSEEVLGTGAADDIVLGTGDVVGVKGIGFCAVGFETMGVVEGEVGVCIDGTELADPRVVAEVVAGTEDVGSAGGLWSKLEIVEFDIWGCEGILADIITY